MFERRGLSRPSSLQNPQPVTRLPASLDGWKGTRNGEGSTRDASLLPLSAGCHCFGLLFLFG